MRVTRFCSRKEYDAFMRGETLTNDINHYRDGKGGSRSIGFCFMAEDPKECWPYLKGIVVPEVCMVLDFPDGYLTKSMGRYADHSTANGSMMKTEYCTTRYDNKTATLVRVVPTEEYADDTDLMIMKIFPELFRLKKSEAGEQAPKISTKKNWQKNW